jgi:hypothetical protein
MRPAEMEVTAALGRIFTGRSQPAVSQASGIENSAHPQSMHAFMSGAGVTGGWLSVRGEFRKRRTSAAMVATASD